MFETVTAPIVREEIRVTDPELYRVNPHPTFDWLRANAPVFWDDHAQIWTISKHRDVFEVERNAALFISGGGIRPEPIPDISLISMDAPAHTTARRIVNKGFTPRMIGRLADRIQALTRAELDRFASAGEADFVADLAYRVPLKVITHLLGLPAEDWELLGSWSDRMLNGISVADPESPEGVAAMTASAEAFAEYMAYLVDVIADRHENPSDDLIGLIVAAGDDGRLEFDEATFAAHANHADTDGGLLDVLGTDDLLMFLVLLLVAGNETTRNATSAGMVAFTENRDQWDLLVQRPDLIDSAVEEVLRMASSVTSFMRTATADTEIRGQRIRKGERVLVSYTSANRDEDVFDAPHQFRIERDPNPHLAFGIGPHFCLGANLARLQMRIVYQELLARLPDIRVAPGAGARRAPNALVQTIDELPVVFTPS